MSIRHGIADVLLYAIFSPLIVIIALPVIVAGVSEIIIKKIDPEYFNT